MLPKSVKGKKREEVGNVALGTSSFHCLEKGKRRKEENFILQQQVTAHQRWKGEWCQDFLSAK